MKRFYETVAMEEVAEGATFRVCLDARPIKTPGRQELILPSRSLADAIAEEWREQKEKVVPATMPLTRLAGGAIDRVASQRTMVVDEIAAYSETDMLCYRADQPVALVKRQHETWQPILDWAEQRYRAKLTVTVGVVPVAQPPDTLDAIKHAVAAQDDMRLSALHAVTHAAGSVILGMALIEGRLDATAVVTASQLDEQVQSEQWGEDTEAAERRAALAVEVSACARFVDLLRGSS